MAIVYEGWTGQMSGAAFGRPNRVLRTETDVNLPNTGAATLLPHFVDGGVEVEGLGVFEGVAVLDRLSLDDPFNGEFGLLPSCSGCTGCPERR